jgi:transposase
MDSMRSRRQSEDERGRPAQGAQEQALLASLKSWFEHQCAPASAKAKIADEIRYGLNHRDGSLKMAVLSSTIVERGIRPTVLNRRNALFAATIMER